MKIVSNSTPLIALARIKQLDLLHTIFGTVIVPEAVYHEVVREDCKRPGVKEVKEAAWIKKLTVQDTMAVSLLGSSLDRGEAEAIVLAKEVKADYLLMDEKKGRRVARNSGLKIMGTLGVASLSVKMGLLPGIDQIFNHLEQNGFRFAEDVKEKIKEEIKASSS